MHTHLNFLNCITHINHVNIRDPNIKSLLKDGYGLVIRETNSLFLEFYTQM